MFKNLLNTLKEKEKPAILFLFFLTLLLRSLYVIIVYKNEGLSNWNDDRYYLLIGEQIAEGNWYPVAPGEAYMRVAPWIPIVVAAFIRLFGDPVLPFFIYNILLSSILVIVLFKLGKELVNIPAAWLMALWACFNIEFFKYTPHLLKEPTVYLLVPLVIYFLVKQIKEESNLYLILAALSFEILIHTDERFFLYLPLFPLLLFFNAHFKLIKNFKSISIWIGVVLLLMLPWSIRNFKEYNQVVIISHRTTAFTSKLWGNDISGMRFINIGQNSSFEILSESDKTKNSEKKLNTSSKHTRSKLYINTFINIWRPAYFKTRKVQYSWWENVRYQKWSLRHNLVSLIFYGIFLPFYLIGLIKLFKKENALLFFIGMLPLIHSMLHTYMVMPEERYRYPVVFIVVMIGIWYKKTIFESFTLSAKPKN